MANATKLIDEVVNNKNVPEDLKKKLREAKLVDLSSGDYVAKGKHLDELEKLKNETANKILELQQQIEKQTADLDKFKEVDLDKYKSIDGEKAKLIKNHELDLALVTAGVQDIKSARVHFDDLDTISDVNEAVAKLKETKTFLFAGEKVAVPNAKASGTATADDEAEKTMRKGAGLKDNK